MEHNSGSQSQMNFTWWYRLYSNTFKFKYCETQPLLTVSTDNISFAGNKTINLSNKVFQHTKSNRTLKQLTYPKYETKKYYTYN